MGEYDEIEGRHQAFYVSKKDMGYRHILVRAGERVRVEESYKYSPLQRVALWARSGLRECTRFGTESLDTPYCE